MGHAAILIRESVRAEVLGGLKFPIHAELPEPDRSEIGPCLCLALNKRFNFFVPHPNSCENDLPLEDEMLRTMVGHLAEEN